MGVRAGIFETLWTGRRVSNTDTHVFLKKTEAFDGKDYRPRTAKKHTRLPTVSVAYILYAASRLYLIATIRCGARRGLGVKISLSPSAKQTGQEAGGG